MAEVFRERRRQLLRHLLRNKGGATVNELAHGLGVTRTAIRQHLASLMRDGPPPPARPCFGRAAEAAFRAHGKGREAFPRHYSWFAQLLIEAMAQEHGATGFARGWDASRRPSWPSCAGARRRPAPGGRKLCSYRR